jgi:hypothetical protein
MRTVRFLFSICLVGLMGMPALLGAVKIPVDSLPIGTEVEIQLTTTLSSSANKVGDPFLGEVENPIFLRGEEVIPAGSTLRGHVTYVKRPGRLHGKAEMRVVADSILTKDRKTLYQFKAGLVSVGLSSETGVKQKGNEGTLQGPGKSVKQSAKDTGIATAAGAGAGAIIAGGQGALYGAGIGALAMAAGLLARHHKDVVVGAGTDMTFQLTTLGTRTNGSKLKGYSAPFVCPTCQ